MKCPKCEQEKPDYHFFAFRGNYLKDFFANPLTLIGQCFDCNGPYKCVYCGVVQDASEFRVGGRVCNTCKSVGIHNVAPVAEARNDQHSTNDTLDAANALESGETA